MQSECFNLWVYHYLVGDIESLTLRGIVLVTVEADGQLLRRTLCTVHLDVVPVAVQLEVYEPQKKYIETLLVLDSNKLNMTYLQNSKVTILLCQCR